MFAKPPGIPDVPGSYQFRDDDSRIIYVGKAKSLRSRLSSYFAPPKTLHPKVAQMMSEAASVEWIEVRNDLEAFLLEYNLIKEHRPRFNVRLVDDSSYPYLRISMQEEWPSVAIVREKRRKGARYFGPYVGGRAIRETLEYVLRTFPVRTCNAGKYARHEAAKRPCLLYHIEKCSAPCVGEVDAETYAEYVDGLSRFLQGDVTGTKNELEQRMNAAAEALDFERAAKLRDRLTAIEQVVEKQTMSSDVSVNADVFGWYGDELQRSVQVFFVRRGRVVGRNGFVLEMDHHEAASALRVAVEHQYMGSASEVPSEVLVPSLPENAEDLAEALRALRNGAVELRVPQRGDKRTLLDTVTKNAQQDWERRRLRRVSDADARAKALQDLQNQLGLPEAPLRIECYDMSHIQGTDYVGSMVVMEDGLMKPKQYRRFRIKTVEGNDDFAAMEEVLRRRLIRLRDERLMPPEERKRFSYRPNLIVVDGGKGQLGVAMQVREELGFEDDIALASLAKRLEEVFLPGESDSILLDRKSESLYLLQQLRDEAHRFAIMFHRELRAKRMKRSVLDDVPGLGPKRQKRLLKQFGSLKKLRALSLEDLLQLGWLPRSVAEALFRELHETSGDSVTE